MHYLRILILCLRFSRVFLHFPLAARRGPSTLIFKIAALSGISSHYYLLDYAVGLLLLILAGGNLSPRRWGFLSPMCQLMFTQARGLRMDHRIS